jgi:anti-anti-sigma regulatory factor
MLRISTDKAKDGAMTLLLEGQLAGPWVRLLRESCDENASGVGIILDLSNVSFADREGIKLLRDLVDRGFELRSASPFIAEQIRKETR